MNFKEYYDKKKEVIKEAISSDNRKVLNKIIKNVINELTKLYKYSNFEDNDNEVKNVKNYLVKHLTKNINQLNAKKIIDDHLKDYDDYNF